MIGPQPRKIAFDENVSVENEEAVLQQLARTAQGPRRAERRSFSSVRNLNAEALAGAEMSFDAVGKM